MQPYVLRLSARVATRAFTVAPSRGWSATAALHDKGRLLDGPRRTPGWAMFDNVPNSDPDDLTRKKLKALNLDEESCELRRAMFAAERPSAARGPRPRGRTHNPMTLEAQTWKKLWAKMDKRPEGSTALHPLDALEKTRFPRRRKLTK